MKKNYKIALLTPLHPLKTGIADYIEEMLPYIRKSFGDLYTIDIFIDHYTPSNEDTKTNHRILEMDDFEKVHNDYDLSIYQMGNNNYHLKIYNYAMKYPGLLVMHDFAIHHLVAFVFLDQMKDDVAYFQAVQDNHGKEARDQAYQRAVDGKLGLWETDAITYPMNRTIIQQSKGVIVFSEYSKKRIIDYGDHIPVHRVYLHCSGKAQLITRNETENARKILGIRLQNKEILVCVFGFIGKAKRPYSILEATHQLINKGYRIRLIFVGQLQGDCKDFPEKIKKTGMKKNVSLTGFTSSEDFDRYVKAADICISLRYPTMGETSGVLMRALRYGKPSIVTNIGTFQEFPNDTVIKIGYENTEIEELSNALQRLIDHPEERQVLSNNGVKYAAQHLEPQLTADSFASFAKEIIRFDEIKKDPNYIQMRDKMLRTNKSNLKKAAKLLAEKYNGK